MSPDDPFYQQVPGIKREISETPRTEASVQDAYKKIVVAKNVSNGIKLESTEKEVLDHIHKMRLQMFEKRRAKDSNNEKPYLPMLSSDEKELIME